MKKFNVTQFRVDDMRKIISDKNINEQIVFDLFKTSDENNNNARKIPQEILFMDWKIP